MQKLNKISAVVAIMAIAASVSLSPVFAQTRAVPKGATETAPVNPSKLIASTIKAFPSGGEPLKIAISDLIVKNPSLAASVAAYLKNEPSLAPAQRQAIFAGLADGVNRMGIVAQETTGLTPGGLAILGGVAAGVGGFLIIKASQDDDDPPPPPRASDN